jgi:ATP-binding cassette subfamily C protein
MVSEILRIRYAYGFCHRLRKQVLESYASKRYGFFLHRNTAALNQRLYDIQTFIQNVLLPIGELLTRLIVVILLIGAVFLVQPWVALGAVFVFGGFYLLVFLWVRPRTREVGKGLQLHNEGFGKNVNQFLQGIKTVLVHGKGRHFVYRALENSARIGHFQSKIPIYSNGPRYLIEPIAFGGLVAIVVVMALRGRPFSDILPNLSVMALAGYRLLPALQLMYSQLVTMAAHSYILAQLEEDILDIEEEISATQEPPMQPAHPLQFRETLQLDQITFRYPGAAAPILNDFTLTIVKNESVGIAGPSGSGKSTLVDLILGLHTPQAGAIRVDGEALSESNLTAWRRMIGYVPQDIYLLDDTIEANIAFGVDSGELDPAALREAAEGAQILDFITQDLPLGFKTTVGERGVRLSGGQRQRIGLARALYHRPQVLILDEATSALDYQTELAVMETIYRLQGTLTIITIAHRLSTLDRCNRIIPLENGRQSP